MTPSVVLAVLFALMAKSDAAGVLDKKVPDYQESKTTVGNINSTVYAEPLSPTELLGLFGDTDMEGGDVQYERDLAKKKKPKIGGRIPKKKVVVDGPAVTFSSRIVPRGSPITAAYVSIEHSKSGASVVYTMEKVAKKKYSVTTQPNIWKGKYNRWRIIVVQKNGVETKTGYYPLKVKAVKPPVTTGGIVHGLQPDCLVDDTTKYNMCLDLVSPSGEYEDWMRAFASARDRWEEVIVGDHMPKFSLESLSSVNIATEVPDFVDDIYIAGVLQYIDGPSGILGSAGPRILRNNGDGYWRPIAGRMKFDAADLDGMVADGSWENVILHEMGHVLGIGTAWAHNNLHSGSGSDDVYKGFFAKEEWKAIGCDGQLPIETDGGSGTAGGHWDEVCLDDELMTGYSEPEGQDEYLSRITIGSLKDIGYTVDFTVADEFGKDQLGPCGNYCSTRRVRRASEVEKKKKKKEISAEGHAQIRQAAFQELREAQLETPALQSPNDIYVGGDIVTIYIRDVDGHIKEQTVAWEEVKAMGDTELQV